MNALTGFSRLNRVLDTTGFSRVEFHLRPLLHRKWQKLKLPRLKSGVSSLIRTNWM